MAVLSACLTIVFGQQAWAKLDTASLEQQVSASQRNFKGRLGVGVIDLQTGDTWYFNGDKQFPMESVAKVPVAIAALRQVDAGKLDLKQEIPLTKSDVSKIRHGYIPEKISQTAKTATLASLIEGSIRRSNNGAVDVLMRTLGGPSAINTVINDAKISGIRVDRCEGEVALSTNSKQELLDSATPRGICDLLNKLNGGKLLSKQSTAYLLDLMSHCQTGTNRIPAGVPKNWTVAHKTGTGPQINGASVATNDVAIITRPDKSSWILTVFVDNAKVNQFLCENKIAEVAKALYTSTR
jgi:beta-lactamase class A